MDLRLFGRVLKRFRVLVTVGVLLAVLLATLSYVKVGSSGIRYRSEEQWISYTRLFVTQQGFNWGSSLINPSKGSQPDQSSSFGLQQASESRLSALANLYSNLIDSDPVRALMLRQGPIKGSIEAAALPIAQGSDSVLPIISIAGISNTPKASLELSARAAKALQTYIENQQAAHGIAPTERIVLSVVNKASGTRLFAGRKKTLPIVVFLTVLFAVGALAFTLENLRPRIKEVSPSMAPGASPERIRQTAS
jgi:hypothetical protein